jgi:hypothetical protein
MMNLNKIFENVLKEAKVYSGNYKVTPQTKKVQVNYCYGGESGWGDSYSFTFTRRKKGKFWDSEGEEYISDKEMNQAINCFRFGYVEDEDEEDIERDEKGNPLPDPCYEIIIK